MNCKNHYTAKLNLNNNSNSYYLSIRNNDTNVLEEMYLSEKEYKVLSIAVNHNRGIVNLLSDKETIYSLYRKGLVTLSSFVDDKCLPMVNNTVNYVLSNKDTTEGAIKKNNSIINRNIVLEETNSINSIRPNSFFKICGNLSVCFFCL